jgi:hypothetical protein
VGRVGRDAKELRRVERDVPRGSMGLAAVWARVAASARTGVRRRMVRERYMKRERYRERQKDRACVRNVDRAPSNKKQIWHKRESGYKGKA